MLTRYGTDNIIVMIILGIGLIVLSYYISITWIRIPILILSCIIIFMAFYFFRDPERHIPEEAQHNNSIVLAPADGKVMNIIEVIEKDYIKTHTKRISIFLSPLDVHVNRSPVSGKIEFIDYQPGKFLAAYDHAASDKNEQSKIGVMTDFGPVLFKQIVGALARRVVYEVMIGNDIKSGEKFGMMKFGSRMDIFLPLDTDILCKVGDKIIAGETIIAKMR
ncbi:MAG TPA: phosphatidylserine decarboxylase family protein [Candidatus Kapabacteria bacterium]|nr:phosphatidylserine decarboxylase family protein [Candidatus Kapabacteria bacterium]